METQTPKQIRKKEISNLFKIPGDRESISNDFMMSSELFQQIKAAAKRHPQATDRPLVTLSYAQSIDGSITNVRGKPMPLSGKESLELTHKLRDLHDAILIGIGTVLADDPRLTVRGLAGDHPQPVILDSQLRFPLKAQLWSHPLPPWIFVHQHCSQARIEPIRARGGQVYKTPKASGRFLDIRAVLEKLGKLGIRSVMVEGGAAVITSFLAQNLVDKVIVTISPTYVGGLRSLEDRLDPLPKVKNVTYEQFGNDLVLMGDICQS